MKLSKSAIKLTGFTGIVLAFFLFVKTVSPSLECVGHIPQGKKNNTFSVYFIGCSRVQRSIDPVIIQRYFNHEHVYNLGISGSTFLSNCILSDAIIRKEGPKIIFIELLTLSPVLSSDFLLVSKKFN